MERRIVCTLFAVVLTLGATLSDVAFAQSQAGAKAGSFTGDWTMTGDTQPLILGPERQVATFQIEGLFNLRDDTGVLKDFWSECIGLADPVTGGIARCVWRDRDGHRIFSELTGKRLLGKDESNYQGKLVGGTGKYTGIQGSYTLTWTSIFQAPEDQVFERHKRKYAGFARSIKGEWRLP